MAAFKVVIADPESGKCEQKEASSDAAKALLGLKIGDTVSGELFGLAGKTLVVRGGSDDCGFPMRSDLPGVQRKRILITKGTGFAGEGKGIRSRRTVAGNTIHPKTVQVNLTVQVQKRKRSKEESLQAREAAKAAKKEKKKEAKTAAEQPPAEEKGE